MSDIYQAFATSNVGRTILKSVNLPTPVNLERYQQDQTSFTAGNLLLGCSGDGRCRAVIEKTLADSSAKVFTSVTNISEEENFKSLVFDATTIKNSAELIKLYQFFQPAIKRIQVSGRIVVIGTPPEEADTPQQAVAMRALEGFIRAVGKEVKKGCTTQLIYVAKGAEPLLRSPLRFVLSPKSAYVSAQVIRVTAGQAAPQEFNWQKPLLNKVALVTGASRGIGASIAEALARDGAKVICLDVPQAADSLQEVAKRINGDTLLIDITAENAPTEIATKIKSYSGIDIFVHNAGVTRDKTLGNMPEHFWQMVIDINLSAEERINDRLFEEKLINPQGRIICVSSMSGIAGNFGQTNYATSKAGVIGLVQAYAPIVAKLGITINAVAPGFIETQMTDAMPFTIREAGRRMNSLSQGGRPQDVAETIAFFASPASSGINGNVIRVCGQSLIGA